MCFYARQRSYSAYVIWQFRLSVHLSVCLYVYPSIKGVKQSKAVVCRSEQFPPYSNPLHPFFSGLSFIPKFLEGIDTKMD